MIQWEFTLPFMTKSNADMILKVYTRNQVREMIKNITLYEMKHRMGWKKKKKINAILADLNWIMLTM